MKTFKIIFKLYYREQSDWFSEYFRAKSEQGALKQFARKHRIKDADPKRPRDWQWWDNDWLCHLRSIQEVAGQPHECAACGGTGMVEPESR